MSDSTPTKDNTEPMISEKHGFSMTAVYRIIIPIIIVIILVFGAYTLLKINMPSPTSMKMMGGMRSVRR